MWGIIAQTPVLFRWNLPIQGTPLVFNYFESSCEALLERVNMPSLPISRIRLIAIKIFEIVPNMSPSLCRTL